MMNLYIGNYIEVLETFHSDLKVHLVIAEKRKVDERILRYCEVQDIQIEFVETPEDIIKIGAQIKSATLCIVASFGLLLKNDFLERIKWVVNIHPGNLRNCRGRHPLPFAIKKGLKFMTLTAHLIESEKFDSGPIIAEVDLPIDYDSSYKVNDRRLRECLPFMTDFIIRQVRDSGRIISSDVNLSTSKYNKRLSLDELEAMMNSKSLKNYKQ